ncbi:general secretion pathway protein [Halothece sp. PCC 7418]|uniref:type IV pilin-like G/H family protein n=1 Tax=Halothece sp. (strain PCC 7418) TaxID=65093 RepID=UPI0002A088F9|nr:type IV pilin-like G/H family protein [Halothece sp. PCC 7418]AFZ43493.1 general secretion pathway protein [Halothece sp. PCC 7418]
MQTNFQARLLQFLNEKKRNQGFTLIELLVVIIIIGILSAVALPTFLNQAGKARQAGAESIIGALNRAQQAYRVEDGVFTDAYTSLDVGYSSAPDAEGYTFPGTMSASADLVRIPVTSANTSDQPNLCGAANLSTTGIDESNSAGTAACPF